MAGRTENYHFQSRRNYRLNVELAELKMKEAINQIGETPFLQFAEVEQVEIRYRHYHRYSSPEFIPSELNGRYMGAQPIKRSRFAFSEQLEFNDEGAKLFEELTEKYWKTAGNISRQ